MDQRMSASELYERGLVLKQLKMFYRAIEDFRKAASDTQCAGKAYVQMALCLKAVGRHEDAVMAFRHASAAPLLSPEEHRHILYHLGRALESLERYEESLEVYGWIRNEEPEFCDVAQRIRHLTMGGRGPVSPAQGPWEAWMEMVCTLSRALKPQMRAFLEQTGQWLSRQARILRSRPEFQNIRSCVRDTVIEPSYSSLPAKGRIQPALMKCMVEHRRHARFPVRLQSYFTTKGRMVAGKGELRDLSPWGCRVVSTAVVPVGADIQCCIFPRDGADAFVVDGATVRWIRPQEFGLAFTNVNPDIQQQIVQLCGAAA